MGQWGRLCYTLPRGIVGMLRLSSPHPLRHPQEVGAIFSPFPWHSREDGIIFAAPFLEASWGGFDSLHPFPQGIIEKLGPSLLHRAWRHSREVSAISPFPSRHPRDVGVIFSHFPLGILGKLGSSSLCLPSRHPQEFLAIFALFHCSIL